MKTRDVHSEAAGQQSGREKCPTQRVESRSFLPPPKVTARVVWLHDAHPIIFSNSLSRTLHLFGLYFSEKFAKFQISKIANEGTNR